MRAENLVFLPDSPYSEWIIKRSELMFPGLNTYLIVVEDLTKNPRFSNSEIQVLENNELNRISQLWDLRSFKRIIVNYHTPFIGHFLMHQKSQIENAKLIWVIWSGDLYKHKSFKSKAYTPLTLKSLAQENIFPSWKENIQHRILNLMGKPNKYCFEKSFQQFDFVATLFEKDKNEAETALGVKAQWIPFAIISLEEMFSEDFLRSKPILGNKIMVGHSGAPENNHLDVFQKINELVPEKEFQILSPLSYGNGAYIKIVKEEGLKFFGEKFEVLSDFIPRENYYIKLAEASHAIFNHKIQQAFGNILGLIFMGVKVFLNPENPIYIELRNQKVHIFDYSKLSKEDLSIPLSDAEADFNRLIVKKLFNENKIRSYYRDLYLS